MTTACVKFQKKASKVFTSSLSCIQFVTDLLLKSGITPVHWNFNRYEGSLGK